MKAASVRSRHRSGALLADTNIYFATFPRVTSGELSERGADDPSQGGRHVQRWRAEHSFFAETVLIGRGLGSRASLLPVRLRILVRGSDWNQASRHDDRNRAIGSGGRLHDLRQGRSKGDAGVLPRSRLGEERAGLRHSHRDVAAERGMDRRIPWQRQRRLRRRPRLRLRRDGGRPQAGVRHRHHGHGNGAGDAA